MTNDFDLPAIRTMLLGARKAHGFDTPAGHRCSNILEMLENLAKNNAIDGDPFVTADQRRNLERDIQIQMAELAALTSSGKPA